MRVILQVAIPSDSGQVSTFIEVYESDFDYERVAIPSDSGQVSTQFSRRWKQELSQRVAIPSDSGQVSTTTFAPDKETAEKMSQSLLIQGRFQQK